MSKLKETFLLLVAAFSLLSPATAMAKSSFNFSIHLDALRPTFFPRHTPPPPTVIVAPPTYYYIPVPPSYYSVVKEYHYYPIPHCPERNAPPHFYPCYP